MNLFQFDPATVFSFVLTLMRISLVVFLLPFFGANLLPNMVKAAFCLMLTLAVFPMLSFPGTMMPANVWSLSLMLLGEVVMGLLLNILVLFLFAAVQCAGAIMGFSMGFSLMNSMDPLTGASESGLGHLMSQVTTMLFLSLNGHLVLLGGLAQSFKLVPPGGLLISPALGEHLIVFSGQMFVMALKIAAPIMASIFLVDLALALVARAAPQMNVLFIGFPLKIGVGFLFMTLVFGALALYVGRYVAEIGPMYTLMLKASG
ncbi:flagellar biosynthetic protein FliR [Solidesulfovibrio fructosivorans JJ]]|uniref:Flagellar biosynthetic protein FliR n=1 Tax=Solidesulfovibrio fructosivorans JJ] TaxID=596151 RepID=E1JYP1_SOLFR|nr:flagellar biosynthetic protein FliR [Solidesulfovibrio fructosivorans]EFL50461.1 flagellar biosynthetic protein FliR [Solidesulfovibrio fructosivorans JJ]]